MNAFTKSQKWVLTATLLAILGVNVSFNPQKIGSADFSSISTKTGEINVADGVVLSVTYIDMGNGKFMAMVPKVNTEGQVCSNCGFESIPLTTNGSTDIGQLNTQVMRALTAINRDEDVVRTGVEEVVGEEEVAVRPSALERVRNRCERKSDSTDALECFKDKFLSLLKTKAGKELEPDDALEFYKEEIERRLITELREARRIASQARRASLSMEGADRFQDSDDFYKDPEQMINTALRTIEDLLANTPEKFDSIRRSLVRAEGDILKYQVAEIKQTQAQAQQNIGTYEGLYLTQESNVLLQQLHQTRMALESKTYNALSEAGANGFISMTAESNYKNLYNDYQTRVINALTGQSAFLDSVTTTGGIDLTGRTQNPGRGVGIVGQSISTQEALVKGTTDISDNLYLVPDVSTNIVFGQPMAITPQSLKMQQMLRVNQ